MSNIRTSIRAYESFLASALGEALVPDDLERKHEKMRQDAFTFLRATFWRFAETVIEAAPDTLKAPSVPAVGDIHLENFGTWRDADGRLVWGVNDFDEAAEMPFTLDLIRLATSALLAVEDREVDARTVMHAIVSGYRKGLEAPQPFVLDRDHKWLRKLVSISERARVKFWEKLNGSDMAAPPQRFVSALIAAVPDPPLPMQFSRRAAGTGSLGRLRVLGRADWRGAPLLREAKALAPSAWTRGPGGRAAAITVESVARGRFRAPDPWYHCHDDLVVRRISPNARKIEVDEEHDSLFAPRMLRAMGFELANIHLGGATPASILIRHLDRMPRNWLVEAARTMAEVTSRDFQAYRDGGG